jgi:regulator of sigma D
MDTFSVSIILWYISSGFFELYHPIVNKNRTSGFKQADKNRASGIKQAGKKGRDTIKRKL